MKQFLTLLLVISFLQAPCQALDSANSLYNSEKYTEALEIAIRIVRYDSSGGVCDLLGRIYTDMGKYDSAILYSQKAIKLDGDESWISGWSHAYLGKALLLKGEKEKGVTELRKAIDLNKTKNSVDFAQSVLSEPNWIVVEGKHISYHFQDTAGWSDSSLRYIAAHERAYVKLNGIFKAELPRKLIFYVWTDMALAEQLLHKPLGFTKPVQCICHVRPDQTVGHEMTHALSYWAWGTTPVYITQFINEGLAVACDGNGGVKRKLRKATIATRRENIHSVKDLWLWGNYDARNSVLYPVGGAFVGYLYQQSTPEQFKALIKNQSVASAETIYGKERFEKLIADFDRLLELK